MDLSFGNWRENVRLAARDGRVRMLKITPEYHLYELDDTTLGPLVEEAHKHNLVVSLQMRVEDKRSQYPFLGVVDLNIMDVAKALGQFPEQIFVVRDIYRRKIEAILKWLTNVYLDIAGVETAETLEWLKANFGLDRFVFATHAPFYFPEGSCCKLTCSQLGQEELEKVAFRNAAGLFDF